MKRHDDRNLRSMMAQLLTLGVILLIIACVLLGWDISEHVGHATRHGKDTNVNVNVSTKCVDTQPSWPVVTGNG